MKIIFYLCIFFSVFVADAQRAYQKGDVIADFGFNHILNFSAPEGFLHVFKNDLTVIDFFGTWCIPCVKALPHLADIQARFNNRVTIFLVSNEEMGQLEKFVAERLPFHFPIVSDNQNNFISLFQPPSYPYTIVINKAGRIIDARDAASLNDLDIIIWLEQETTQKPDCKEDTATIIKTSPLTNLKSSHPLVDLSQQYIYAVKTGAASDSIAVVLKNLPYSDLLQKLIADDEKKAFWINVYNGYTQVILNQHPEKYQRRGKFFMSEQIEIAGKKLALTT